tara:strand:+ start:652 stop:873 length:222 start_codon:yes stop_codon:yes gene_type:complete
MREFLKGFSNAMWDRGHMNMRCPECGAVMWLEGDDEVTVMLMRYATHQVDECKTCTSVHDAWDNEGVFDVEKN